MYLKTESDPKDKRSRWITVTKLGSEEDRHELEQKKRKAEQVNKLIFKVPMSTYSIT